LVDKLKKKKKKIEEEQLTEQLLERYRASMILAGVGDAIGYKNGKWFVLSLDLHSIYS
jgi:hypothetical protein